MDMNAMTPYGQALYDYYNGNKEAMITIRRDDNVSAELPVWIFFNEEANFSVIERKALESCRGRVLDAGAGSGRHSLYLTGRGFETTSIDISGEAVEIMKKRGLKEVYCKSIFDFNDGGFDTILLLLHGIGMVGTLEGFERFLAHAGTIINPGGVIIFDSLDVKCTNDPENLKYQEQNIRQNRYIGEIHMQFEYKGIAGKPFSWLHLDPETLKNQVSALGWQHKIIHQEASGDYLVVLYK